MIELIALLCCAVPPPALFFSPPIIPDDVQFFHEIVVERKTAEDRGYVLVVDPNPAWVLKLRMGGIGAFGVSDRTHAPWYVRGDNFYPPFLYDSFTALFVNQPIEPQHVRPLGALLHVGGILLISHTLNPWAPAVFQREGNYKRMLRFHHWTVWRKTSEKKEAVH